VEAVRRYKKHTAQKRKQNKQDARGKKIDRIEGAGEGLAPFSPLKSKSILGHICIPVVVFSLYFAFGFLSTAAAAAATDDLLAALGEEHLCFEVVGVLDGV
jgi:hypothetical protein